MNFRKHKLRISKIFMDNWQATLAMHDEPWPEDTQRKRVADLQEFVRNYSRYLDTLPQDEREDLLAQTNTQFLEAGNSACQQMSEKNKDNNDVILKNPYTFNNENKWDLETTLELLDSMKAYVIRHKVYRVGVCISRWMEIAMSLANPREMEFRKFARSCAVRYETVRRHLNAGKSREDENIRKSVIQYLQICDRYVHNEKVRLKLQNIIKFYKYRHHAQYPYSRGVTKEQGEGAEQKYEETILSLKSWKRNSHDAIGDDCLLLVPSENSEFESGSEKESEFSDASVSLEIGSPRESQTDGESKGKTDWDWDSPSHGNSEQKKQYRGELPQQKGTPRGELCSSNW